MSLKKQKGIMTAVKTLTVILLCVSFFSYFSFNYFYVYGHINSFSDGAFSLLQWLKLAALVMIPAAVFLKSDKPVMTVKWFFVIVPLLSLAFIGKYLSFSVTLVYEEQITYAGLNQFMPQWVKLTLFILESLLMAAISALFFVRDGFKAKTGAAFETADVKKPRPIKICKMPLFGQKSVYSATLTLEKTDKKTVSERYNVKNFLMLIPVFFCVMPLSLFDNIVQFIPTSSGFYEFLRFKNFSVWHFLAFGAVFVSTYLAYRFLKKKSSESRYRYMRVFAIAMLVQYMSKASRLLGDGYNVYYTIIAFIPLFICNIGVPIAAAAIFTKNKTLNNMAFFVHAAGALTVFFYFGKDDMSNYGAVINYSFLYFAFTHAALFMLCVLPTLLKEHKFRLKGSIIPMAYYAGVIVVAAIASELVTSLTIEYYGEPGLTPNYAFTQINPLPIELPKVAIVTIFGLPFDMLYLPLLFLAYVAIFFIVYGGYYLIIELPPKIKQRRLSKQSEIKPPAGGK